MSNTFSKRAPEWEIVRLGHTECMKWPFELCSCSSHGSSPVRRHVELYTEFTKVKMSNKFSKHTPEWEIFRLGHTECMRWPFELCSCSSHGSSRSADIGNYIPYPPKTPIIMNHLTRNNCKEASRKITTASRQDNRDDSGSQGQGTYVSTYEI
jgi:hypothetical protein